MFRSIYFLVKVFAFIISQEFQFWKIKSLTKQGKTAEKDMILRQSAKKFADVVLNTAGVKVIVEGLDNLPEKNTPIVFTPNHSSFFDIPIMLYAYDDILGFVSKAENAKLLLIGKWIKESYSVYIDRSSATKAITGLKAGVEILKQGHSQVIFPEGTRSRDGSIQKFKAGSYKLAKLSNSTVIPVAIYGAAKIVQKNAIITPQTIHLKFFKPLDSSLNTVEMAQQSEQLIKSYINKFI